MASHKAINNFTGGEWTPQLDGRSDLQKYDMACLQLENFRPLPWGGVTFRPGTIHANGCRTDAHPARVIPFNYSTDLGYAIEMTGDGFLRFFYAQGPNAGTPVVTGPSTPYEIAMPYGYADIFAVKFRQVNGVMYMAQPGYPVQKLTYLGSPAAWAIAAVPWKYPSLLDQNVDQSKTLALSAISGAGVTMTAAGHTPFVAGHVGAYWEIQQLRDSSSKQLALFGGGSSAAIPVLGDWSFTTSQYWNGTVQLMASYDGGVTYSVIRQFQSACDGNFSTSGTEVVPPVGQPTPLYKIVYVQLTAPFDASIWTGAAPTSYATAEATLVVNSAFNSALVQVTGFTDSTHVTVTVILPALSTTASYYWSEGAFSAVRGYPSCVDFYEQRILYSGTSYRPNEIWGSVTGDFDNFQFGSGDDSAIAFQPAVAQQNFTQWLCSLLRVHAGTSGEELLMASGNLDEPLTPSNVTIRRQSTYGSTNLDAIQVNNSILFFERNGQRLREMRELSPYVVPTDFVAPDLTLFAEHLFAPDNQAVAMDYGRLPDPLVYVVRQDGTLCVMTYNRDQNITAWARYVTQGAFESVCVVEGTPADSVWVTTKRTINGVTKRFVEVFTEDPAADPDKVANVLVDNALIVTQAPGTVITNLSYLEGMAVSVVADGNYVPNLVVSSGQITLPVAAAIVRVGLPYTGTVQTMKADQAMANGTSQGRQRRNTQVVIRFKDSLGGQFKSSAQPAYESIPWHTLQVPVGQTPALYRGDIPVSWPNGIDFDGSVSVRQDKPYPMTILGIFPRADTFGE